MGTSTRNTGYPRRSRYQCVDSEWYVEPRWCVRQLLDAEPFNGEILDPCCGRGTIVSVCRERGYPARGGDLRDRGLGTVKDLFDITEPVDNVIANIPYRLAEVCSRHILTITSRTAALILTMAFWESRARNALFRDHPLVRWYPCSDRPLMPPGDPNSNVIRTALVQPKAYGGTAPYGWRISSRDSRDALRRSACSHCGKVPKIESIPD
jgi:hypothetical protein